MQLRWACYQQAGCTMTVASNCLTMVGRLWGNCLAVVFGNGKIGDSLQDVLCGLIEDNLLFCLWKNVVNAKKRTVRKY